MKGLFTFGIGYFIAMFSVVISDFFPSVSNASARMLCFIGLTIAVYDIFKNATD
jgi:hypothetical protein